MLWKKSRFDGCILKCLNADRKHDADNREDIYTDLVCKSLDESGTDDIDLNLGYLHLGKESNRGRARSGPMERNLFQSSGEFR